MPERVDLNNMETDGGIVPGGRPSKLSPEVKQRLFKAIKTMCTYEVACAYAGISYSTLREWILKGEKHKTGQYRQFLEELKEAEAEAEVAMAARINLAGERHWQALAWILERRNPETWGRKDFMDANLHHDGGLDIRIHRVPRREDDDDEPTEDT